MKKISILGLLVLLGACATAPQQKTVDPVTPPAPIIHIDPVPSAPLCDVDEMPAIVACTHAMPIPDGATFGTVVDALLTDRRTIEGCRMQLERLRDHMESCNAKIEVHNEQINQVNQKIAALKPLPVSAPVVEPVAEVAPPKMWWQFWRK